MTPLSGIDIDEERIVSSTGALELSSVPDDLVVIGGGVIGLELGSVWMRLGANVTVIEFQDMLLPGMDTDVRKEFKKILTKQGMNFRMGQKVTRADVGSDGVTLSVEPAAGGDAETLTADVVCHGAPALYPRAGLRDLGRCHGSTRLLRLIRITKPTWQGCMRSVM